MHLPVHLSRGNVLCVNELGSKRRTGEVHGVVHLWNVKMLSIRWLMVDGYTSRCTCREGVRCVSMSWSVRGVRGWGITKQETGRVSCGLIGERCCWEYIYMPRTT